MNRMYGLLRDFHYYMTKESGWTYFVIIFIGMTWGRVCLQTATYYSPPNCKVMGIKVLKNGIKLINRCQMTAEEEKELCQLLPEVYGTSKK